MAVCFALYLLANTERANAASVWSPQVMVIALQVRDGDSVLKVGFRRRIEFGAPAFSFNPANCAGETFPFVISGTNVSAHYVDVEFHLSGQTATQRDQMINDIYTAFGNGRMVRFRVRDDACSAAGARLATGVEIQF